MALIQRTPDELAKEMLRREKELLNSGLLQTNGMLGRVEVCRWMVKQGWDLPDEVIAMAEEEIPDNVIHTGGNEDE